MSLGTRALVLVLAAGSSPLLAGCQADTPDHLEFVLRDLSFTVSSDDFRSPPLGGLDTMVCAGPLASVTDCCMPPAPADAIDCQQHPLTCDPDDNLCVLSFDVEATAETKLAEEVAAVAAVNGRAFSSVSLVALTAKVEKSADLPIRSAHLYIGPAGIGTSSNPAARLIAQVPLRKEVTNLELSAEARQAFSSFARDYRAPFSWILAAHVVIRPGFQSPDSEHFDFTVRGQAEAWY